jgi:3'-phosphoadenosine 5'-phosphosulfate (PAPS) 3'-phosphatase
MQEVYKMFKEPQIMLKEGVGSQFIELLEGDRDIHMNFPPKYRGWDVCGPAALLMSRLGYCADAFGKPIIFDARR